MDCRAVSYFDAFFSAFVANKETIHRTNWSSSHSFPSKYPRAAKYFTYSKFILFYFLSVLLNLASPSSFSASPPTYLPASSKAAAFVLPHPPSPLYSASLLIRSSYQIFFFSFFYFPLLSISFLPFHRPFWPRLDAARHDG
jgi:hypothetical protein